MFRVIQLFVFVFVFGRIVHRTIHIRPNSLKPLFGTSLNLTSDSTENFTKHNPGTQSSTTITFNFVYLANYLALFQK